MVPGKLESLLLLYFPRNFSVVLLIILLIKDQLLLLQRVFQRELDLELIALGLCLNLARVLKLLVI